MRSLLRRPPIPTTKAETPSMTAADIRITSRFIDPPPDRCHEQPLRQLDTGHLEPLSKARPDSRGRHVPLDPALLVYAGLPVAEQILHRDDRALHARNLRDMGDPAHTIRKACQLDYHVQSGSHLLPDRPVRQVQSG